MSVGVVRRISGLWPPKPWKVAAQVLFCAFAAAILFSDATLPALEGWPWWRFDARWAWQQAVAADSYFAYSYFRENFPNTRTDTDAAHRIDQIVWKETSSSNTVYGYREYLTKVPNGTYVGEAKARIERLEQAARVASEKSQERTVPQPVPPPPPQAADVSPLPPSPSPTLPSITPPAPVIAERAPSSPIEGLVASYSSAGWPVIYGIVLPIAGIHPVSKGRMEKFVTWLTRRTNFLKCDRSTATAYRCLTSDNEDLAQALLLNCQAKVSLDGTDLYRAAEKQARRSKKGIWR